MSVVQPLLCPTRQYRCTSGAHLFTIGLGMDDEADRLQGLAAARQAPQALLEGHGGPADAPVLGLPGVVHHIAHDGQQHAARRQHTQATHSTASSLHAACNEYSLDPSCT